MFGIQHYPTPANIIRKMLEPYLLNGRLNKKTILEPSAGSGNIVKYIQSNYSNRDVYAIEIDNNLQTLLRDLDCKILGSDFLEFSNRLKIPFDLIVMNPPFKSGAEHLLHAWNILDSGDIVCLLNAETLNNTYSNQRDLLTKIIEDFGSTEYLGSVFKDSENNTDIEVVLVRLHKEVQENLFDFKFEMKHSINDLDLSGEDFKNAVETKDLIGNMMLRFEMSIDSYVQAIKALQYLNFCTQGLTPSYGYDWKLDIDHPQEGYQNFIHTLNSGMWALACDKLGVEQLMTDKVRKDFAKFKSEQGYLEFNKKNVGDLITMLFENQNLILERAISDVFDIFTSYHKENRLYVEGWKTNDRWKVNKKVILPYWVKYGEYMNTHQLKQSGDRFKTNYDYHSKYSDIDKVMSFISGNNYKHINTIAGALDSYFRTLGNVKSNDKFDNTVESTFFIIKFFKKGTIHIEFKDSQLWQEFNLIACKGKNWLPAEEEDAWKKSRQQKQEDMVKPTQQESKYSPSSQQLLLL